MEIGLFLYVIELEISWAFGKACNGRPPVEHFSIIEYNVVSFRL